MNNFSLTNKTLRTSSNLCNKKRLNENSVQISRKNKENRPPDHKISIKVSKDPQVQVSPFQFVTKKENLCKMSRTGTMTGNFFKENECDLSEMDDDVMSLSFSLEEDNEVRPVYEIKSSLTTGYNIKSNYNTNKF